MTAGLNHACQPWLMTAGLNLCYIGQMHSRPDSHLRDRKDATASVLSGVRTRREVVPPASVLLVAAALCEESDVLLLSADLLSVSAEDCSAVVIASLFLADLVSK